jgi:hypothetical protein
MLLTTLATQDLADEDLSLAKVHIFFQHGEQDDTPRAIRQRRDSPAEQKSLHLDEDSLAAVVATLKSNLWQMLDRPKR